MNTEKTQLNADIFTCEKCDFVCSKQSDWDRHIIRPKHQRILTKNTKTQLNADIFTCEKCDFVCSKQSDWARHIIRPKHQRIPGVHKKTSQNATHICAKCSRSYQYNSGLWKHSKSCNATVQIIPETISEHIIITTPVVNQTESIQLHIIEKSSNESNDIKILSNLVLELVKSNTDLQKQMIDMCKNNNITNSHNNNSNYSHNKTFNLQFFLNEQCKDAMNINEFVNSFDLQISDLESVGELGYVDGISKIVLDKLNSMDVYKRPMHCSDAKRETIYIKDANLWTKEMPGNPKLRQAIKNISFNNMKLVYNWSNAYPESLNNQSRLNDTYIKLVLQSSGGSGPILDSENKIMRRIAKEIVIGKI
jgi:uncharacterized C2H2 Zn-finger protein